MSSRYLVATSILALAACDNPGSGGRGGFIPQDTIGGDTATGNDTSGTTSTTDTGETGEPTDTTTGLDTSLPIDTNVGDDTIVPGCTTLPFGGTFPGMTALGGGAWSSPQGIDLGLGGSAPDALMMVFEASQTGTFSLAGQNPGTCVRCFQLAVDVGQGGKTYFANAGSVEVLVSPMQALDVVLTGVTFAEVAGNGSLVSGGECLTVAQVRLEGEGEVCEPDCAGRVCGDNGCGGECGPGCQVGQTCTAQGTCSGGTTGCTTISPTGAIEGLEPGRLAIDVTALGLGTSTLDYLQFEFYEVATGSFNLGTGDNTNYATCMQCVRLFEDATETDVGRQYFQSKGTINVGAGSNVGGDPPTLSITLTDVELVEVTIDGSFNSTKVPSGKCLKISNRTLSTP